MPLIGNFDRLLSLGCRARIAATVAAERMSELAPRMTRISTCDKASNSFHIDGSGRSISRSASVRGQPHVIGGHQRTVSGFQVRSAAASHSSASVWGTGPRKAAKDFGALIEIVRLRQLADIAFDASEPLWLDHRPDVVQQARQ